MNNQPTNQDEQAPRRDLEIICSRRHFFRALLQEAFVVQGTIKGKQGFRISELGSMPDAQLAQVKPVVHRDYEIFVDAGYVWARYKANERPPLKLFPLEQQNLTVFNLFDGRHDLGEIGRRLAQEMGWEEARAFAHARSLFLSLAQYMVCVPKDPLDPEETDGQPSSFSSFLARFWERKTRAMEERAGREDA